MDNSFEILIEPLDSTSKTVVALKVWVNEVPPPSEMSHLTAEALNVSGWSSVSVAPVDATNIPSAGVASFNFFICNFADMFGCYDI